MMDLQSLFGLQGRVALVTGGSRGIGKMIVEGLLEAGCERVYIVARKKEQVDETAAELGDKAKTLIPGWVQHNLAFNYPFPIAIEKADGACKKSI